MNGLIKVSAQCRGRSTIGSVYHVENIIHVLLHQTDQDTAGGASAIQRFVPLGIVLMLTLGSVISPVGSSNGLILQPVCITPAVFHKEG